MEGLIVLVTDLSLAKRTNLGSIPASAVASENHLWSQVGVAGHLSHLLFKALNLFL